MIKKYKKKPIIVEAMKLENTKESFEEAYKWIKKNTDFSLATDGTFIHILIPEGITQLHIGNYLIKGIVGEFYPCRADIFEKTYEDISELNKDEK